jgi:hypothetical protein
MRYSAAGGAAKEITSQSADHEAASYSPEVADAAGFSESEDEHSTAAPRKRSGP